MPTFIGFNTIGQTKRFTLTDFELIKRDILNSFLIKQGEVPGRPLVGTTMQNLMFETQSPETTRQIEQEIRRVIGLDPRVTVQDVLVYSQDNGILCEVALQVKNSTDAQRLEIFFNRSNGYASYT